MKRALAALALFIAPAAEATPLTPIPCPFDTESITTHHATCSRFNREDRGARIGFDVAVMMPQIRKGIGHVLYIPGGPGDAPVAADGWFGDILRIFPDRTLILFNPRGTKGTTPRLDCPLGETVWQEDFADGEVRDILQDCHMRFAEEGPDPMLFTSQHIAEDVMALVAALGLDRVGIYGISYGTEAALHIVATAPDWLDFAILDSVSVPGVAGTAEIIAARDRFLDALSERCFTAKGCTPFARTGYESLTEWAAQFDVKPLALHMNDATVWTLDGTAMLDQLTQLSIYPNGLSLAQVTIDHLATNRISALGGLWMLNVYSIEYIRENLPLLLQAYADTFEPSDYEILNRESVYPRDRQAEHQFLGLYALWRGAQPREANFLNAAPRGAVPVPVLVLSGGLDTLTPPEWAIALHQRFAGMAHYLYPLLGHAVSIGQASEDNGPEMAAQMRCAGAAIQVFLDPTQQQDDECKNYHLKGTP